MGWRQRFEKLGSGLSERILPAAQLQGLGMDPASAQAAQLAAMRQFGIGLLSNVGTGNSFGQGLGQAFQMANQGGLQSAQMQVDAGMRREQMERLKRQAVQPVLVDNGAGGGTYVDAPDALGKQPYAPSKQQEPTSRYVAPGGVLVDDAGKEIYRNEIKPDTPKGREPPSGYRWSKDGNLEAIPGGPNDPSVTNTRKGVQPLRKEFRSLPSVKDYETALPLLVSARKAPDDGYGDLQLIYTAGKVLDPGSVVREGELALTVAAGSPLQRIIGKTRFSVEKGGRLTPETRKQLLGMLNERVMAYRQGYDRDYQQYAQYARESGIDPSQIVGGHAANAYQPKAQPKPAGGKRLRFEDLPP